MNASRPGGEGIRRRPLRERVDALESELEESRRRLRLLENTFGGVLREEGASLAGQCACGGGLLVVRRGTMYCPRCGYRRTI